MSPRPSPAFRLGLVGAGRMGRTHLRALSTSKTVRITAIADPIATAQIPLPHYTDVNAMLDAGNLDGVLIAAPSTQHLALVSRSPPPACRSCARSPAASPPPGARGRRGRRAPQVRLQIAYWRRFVPALQRLRQRIADGELGELYFVACYQWDGEPPSAAVRRPAAAASSSIWACTSSTRSAGSPARRFVHLDRAVASVTARQESAQALCDPVRRQHGLVSLGRRFPLGDVCRVEVFGTRDAEDCRFLWPPDGDTVSSTLCGVRPKRSPPGCAAAPPAARPPTMPSRHWRRPNRLREANMAVRTRHQPDHLDQ